METVNQNYIVSNALNHSIIKERSKRRYTHKMILTNRTSTI